MSGGSPAGAPSAVRALYGTGGGGFVSEHKRLPRMPPFGSAVI